MRGERFNSSIFTLMVLRELDAFRFTLRIWRGRIAGWLKARFGR